MTAREAAYSHIRNGVLQLDELAEQHGTDDPRLTDEAMVTYMQRAQRALGLALEAMGAGDESWAGFPNRETAGVHEHLRTRWAGPTAAMVQRTASEMVPNGATPDVAIQVIASALSVWFTTTLNGTQSEMLGLLGTLGRVDWAAVAARWWAPSEATP